MNFSIPNRILIGLASATAMTTAFASHGFAAEPCNDKNEVIVLGMIHSGHRTSTRYSIDRLNDVIRKIDPDFILTEIPPDRFEQGMSEFRESGTITEPRIRVFPEYVDSIFPLSRDMKFTIVPCAGWTAEMASDRREKIERWQTERANNTQEINDAQQRASDAISKRDWDDDPQGIHTDAYDDIVRRGLEPYNRLWNDDLGLGGWDNINAAHYSNIAAALDAHKGEGKRFLITFGSWHKYWILDHLRKRTDIALLDPRPFFSAVAGASGSGSGTILDGREKTFIVTGYSTSYAWPNMLQDMLDEHSNVEKGSDRIYHVINAVIGGSPVERWIAEKGTPVYDSVFGAMLGDFFGDHPRLRPVGVPPPTIAICQQSLQFTRTLRGPVTTANDEEGIRIGADAIEKMCVMLHDVGIEDVHVAMHIYKKPVEPEVGNERFALKALIERGHDFIHAGPDVWSATIGSYPEAYSEDQLHPNELGMKIMAERWYRYIAGDDADEKIIKAMHARDYDINTMMRDYIAWRRGGATNN